MQKGFSNKIFINSCITCLGSWKRFYAKRRIVSYKRRNFKTALVQFNKDGSVVSSTDL